MRGLPRGGLVPAQVPAHVRTGCKCAGACPWCLRRRLPVWGRSARGRRRGQKVEGGSVPCFRSRVVREHWDRGMTCVDLAM